MKSQFIKSRFVKSRAILVISIVFLLLATTSMVLSAVHSGQKPNDNMRTVAVVEIKEAITPVTEKYIRRALAEAQRNNYDTLLITLDTPGGLLESTRNIVQMLLIAEDIDTIVYVYPNGSRAGSAGVFITLAAKYAAMAPGCNIGAAHPVMIGEEEDKQSIGKILKRIFSKSTNQQQAPKTSSRQHLNQKIENDTIAFIKSICEMRGRNKEWAILAVKESVSITSEEALEKKVVDYIAVSITDLTKQIYGDKIHIQIIKIDKSWGENLLSVLANPNLAYLLFTLGLTGIGVEIRSPGLIFPGTLGALCFILGLYSTQTLPINYAGLALMVLAFVMFVMEMSIVSYGLLTIGGVVSLLIGSAMLFDSPLEFMRVSPSLIAGVTIPIVLLVVLILIFIVPALRNRAVSGKEGMLGEEGIAINSFKNGRGAIRVHGEIWNAYSSTAKIKKGESLKVIFIDGLKLQVEKKL